MQAVREKSLALTSLLMDLCDTHLSPLGFTVGTPRAAERRGGHVALEHPQAASITRALKARGVVPDFRVPYRLTPVPALLAFVLAFAVVLMGTLYSCWRAAVTGRCSGPTGP